MESRAAAHVVESSFSARVDLTLTSVAGHSDDTLDGTWLAAIRRRKRGGAYERDRHDAVSFELAKFSNRCETVHDGHLRRNRVSSATDAS